MFNNTVYHFLKLREFNLFIYTSCKILEGYKLIPILDLALFFSYLGIGSTLTFDPHVFNIISNCEIFQSASTF